MYTKNKVNNTNRTRKNSYDNVEIDTNLSYDQYEKKFLEEFKKMMTTGISVKKNNKIIGSKIILLTVVDNKIILSPSVKNQYIELENISSIKRLDYKKIIILHNEKYSIFEFYNKTLRDIFCDGIILIKKYFDLSKLNSIKEPDPEIKPDLEIKSDLEIKPDIKVNIQSAVKIDQEINTEQVVNKEPTQKSYKSIIKKIMEDLESESDSESDYNSNTDSGTQVEKVVRIKINRSRKNLSNQNKINKNIS